jgi:uncharacterized protein YciI
VTTSGAFTDPPLVELSGAELRARVALARLYLIDTTPTRPDIPVPPEIEREHLAYIYELEHKGHLFAAGPVDAASMPTPPGLTILAAATLAEAERITGHDPLVTAGLARNAVRVHTMNEGVACYVGRAMSRRAEALGESFDPDIRPIGLSYDDLIRRATGAQVCLLSLEPTDQPRFAADTDTPHGHFVWLRTNEMAARLLSCGPVQAAAPLAPGIWGGGLGVVATSRGVAEQIAANEPSGIAGYRTLAVDPGGWTTDWPHQSRKRSKCSTR